MSKKNRSVFAVFGRDHDAEDATMLMLFTTLKVANEFMARERETQRNAPGLYGYNIYSVEEMLVIDEVTGGLALSDAFVR